jgi:hypothetical protein
MENALAHQSAIRQILPDMENAGKPVAGGERHDMASPGIGSS